MAKHILFTKLDPSRNEYEQEFAWVANPRGGNDTDEDRKLIKKRYELTIIGGITDDDASYSYDDWALVQLGKKYYLLSTSGCSCPSPSETWRIEKGPATLDQIRKHVVDGDYQGYTVPKRQMDQFLAVIDAAEDAEVKYGKTNVLDGEEFDPRHAVVSVSLQIPGDILHALKEQAASKKCDVQTLIVEKLSERMTTAPRKVTKT